MVDVYTATGGRVVSGESMIRRQNKLMRWNLVVGLIGLFMQLQCADIQSIESHSARTVDVAVIGGGCAGLAAAFTVAYLKHSVVVFTGDTPGGQLMGSVRVENIPGIVPKSGGEVMSELEEQAIAAGAQLQFTSVTDVTRTGTFVITTVDGAQWHARAIILAMGGTPRLLQVPGEAELLNTRIFTCALCDGKQTENKRVYVIGGGDASIDVLLTLNDFGPCECTLLVRSSHMRAAPRVQERLQSANVTIEYGTRIRAVRAVREGIELLLDTPQGQEVRTTDFLFYAIGHQPATTAPWVRTLATCDAHGYIMVNTIQGTGVPGVFAAGDIASPHFHQASYAIGCGQLAAKSAIDHIKGIS